MTGVHDFAAVGVGPFNLGLACLTAPLDDLDGVFLERRAEFDWHPGMMLDTSALQTPFMADLVTLADPTSRFSYLNYAKQTGHLYSFYIREDFHPLRSEYNDYCRWCVEQLDSLRFGREVTAVTFADDVFHVEAGDETFRARNLVLGTGTHPHVPAGCDGVHSEWYLPARDELLTRDSLAVVGGGQSAAEVFYDLLEAIDSHDYSLTWITRSPRFFPLEYTKLTLEMTSPEYVDYFHALPPDVRDDLVRSQAGLYKGIDSALIDDIFRLLYRKHRAGHPKVRLLTNTEVVGCGDGRLDLRHVEVDEAFSLDAAGAVFATGYRYEVPAFLEPLREMIAWDEHGRFDVSRDFAIDHARERIFVQNAELHTHGFVAPDLGMAAYRNSTIIRELTGREIYPIERSIAMQEFGVPS